MSDLEALEWTLPDRPLTAGDVDDYSTNLSSAFSSVLAEATNQGQGIEFLDATGAIITQYPSDLNSLLFTLKENLIYEKTYRSLEEQILEISDPADVKSAMQGKSNLEDRARELYQEYTANKITAEDLEDEGIIEDSGPGESATAPDVEADNELAAKDEEESAAIAQARKKAEEEAKRVMAEIPVITSRGFNENHFIQANLVNLIDLKLNLADLYEQKAYPYIKGSPNACLMLTGDPFSFLSELSVYPENDDYFNLPSSEIANLQPKIRLYKSTIDPDTKEKVNVPIHFDTALTNTSLQTLLTNRVQRATGVGIKSLSIDYTGVDEFTLHKSFEVVLKIYAASLSDLFKPRVDAATGISYSYIDLALPALSPEDRERLPLHTKDAGKRMTDLSSLDFEIKMHFGISKLSNVGAANARHANALNRNTLALTGKAVEHTFKFQQHNGAVELEIKYMPYIESRFSGADYNILSDRNSLKFNLEKEIREEMLQRTCDTEKNAQYMQKEISKFSAIRKEAASNLIKELGVNSKIRYLPMDSAIVEEFMQTGPNLDWGKLIKLAPFAAFVGKEGNQEALKKDIAKEATDTSKQYRGPLKTRFTTPLTTSARFVYLCDLVDMLMAKMSKANSVSEIEGLIKTLITDDSDMKKFNSDYPEYFKNLLDRFKQSSEDFSKLRVVFGPIEIVDPANPAENSRIVSIGDLPVPIPLLLEYMVKMAGNKNTSHFDFTRFLRNLVETELPNWLNDDTAFNGSLSQNVNINSTTFVGFDSQFGRDDLTEKLVSYNNRLLGGVVNPSMLAAQKSGNSAAVSDVKAITAHRLPMDLLPTPAIETASDMDLHLRDPSQETSFLVFYSDAACPVENKWGNPQADADFGVHHYMVGKNAGIVKDMQLEVYKDDGSMKAMRFTQQHGLGVLYEIYNIHITTYANLNIWPGTIIYVDPRGWVPELDPETMEIYGKVDSIRDLGLGGYYQVIKVGHVLERGIFETKIFAQWFSPGGTGPDLMNSAGGEPNNAPVTKCGAPASTEAKDADTPAPVGSCHGGSAARKMALTGMYGVQEIANEHLRSQGEYGEFESPTTNPS
tara:strand:+ start:20341 stop:23568 length:3228 start_codon:yes stop_codon:yes gene_type:complete